MHKRVLATGLNSGAPIPFEAGAQFMRCCGPGSGCWADSQGGTCLAVGHFVPGAAGDAPNDLLAHQIQAK